MAERTIRGTVYRYDRLPADEAFRIALRIGKLLGKSKDGLAKLVTSGASKDEGAIAIVAEFLAAIDESAVFDLVTTMVKNCRADGELCTIGVKPQYVEEMLEVAAFAFQTEFGSFFDGLAGDRLTLVPRAGRR